MKILIESQTLCCRIFDSLYYEHLPDHLREWMEGLGKYLSSTYSTDDNFECSDQLRCAVLTNLTCLIENHDEAFHEYLNDSASAIFTLLEAVSKSPTRDQLATKAIKFFTTVSTSGHHGLFADENVIKSFCLRVVIPMVFLRDEDEELFEMDYMEFIRRDMGSGLDTRRRMASELLKGLAINYEKQVMDVVIPELEMLCSSASANQAAQWKDKTCAIDLVVSLGASLSTEFVQSIFSAIILPELHSIEVNSFPMLKAASLKFLIVFLSHIPKPIAVHLLMDLARFFQAESNVLQSYAASCIEKFLQMKDEGGKSRYRAGDISPVLLDLMTNMFDALKFTGSEENQCILKCIMRVLGVAEISGEVAECCIAGLTSILSKACKSPKKSAFNHCLFESIALLVRRAWEGDSPLISAFEISLFPTLKIILDNEITEFLPYACQLLSQLLELKTLPLSLKITEIFLLRLSTEWQKGSGNLIALVRMLQAVLRDVRHEYSQEKGLNQVLGLFEKLVSSPRTEEQEQGFDFLLAVFEDVDFSKINMTRVWIYLFTCLQNNTTAKFQNAMLVFMSNLVMLTGSTYIESTMNCVQTHFFYQALDQFFIPRMQLIKSDEEDLIAVVAAGTTLLFDYSFLEEAATTGNISKIWFNLLSTLVKLLAEDRTERLDLVAVENGYVLKQSKRKKIHDNISPDMLVYYVRFYSTYFPLEHIIWNNVDETTLDSSSVKIWLQLSYVGKTFANMKLKIS